MERVMYTVLHLLAICSVWQGTYGQSTVSDTVLSSSVISTLISSDVSATTAAEVTPSTASSQGQSLTMTTLGTSQFLSASSQVGSSQTMISSSVLTTLSMSSGSATSQVATQGAPQSMTSIQPSQSATPSPVPSQSATPSPMPSQSATPSPMPSQSATPSPVPSQSAAPSPVPSQSAAPSPMPSSTMPFSSSFFVPTPTPSNVLQCYSRDQGQRSSRDGDRAGRERLFCPRGTHYCGDGEPASNVTCVPFDLYCDGIPHCSNGDDESADFCGNCNLGSIQCPNSSVCVNNTMVCDGLNNCPDGIDESINACGCPNSTHIPVCRSEDGDPSCIPPEQLCDGMEHCSNGEDESDYYCGKQFFCPGGTLYCENDKPPRGVNCVPFNLTCDGTPQCSNGRDESDDICGNCSTNFIQCYEDPSNTCVSNTVACDGVSDCPDGIDESIDACGCPNSTHIPLCRDDGNTSCVAPEQLCDGVEDCRNGEDESDYYCGYEDDNQFSCDIHDDYNCYLPYDYVCDGERQCPNGRDEQQCGVLQCYSRDQGQRSSRDGDRAGRERLFCPRGTLYCGDGEPASNVTCVAFDLYCDGTSHCSNGDDESADFCGNCSLGSIQCPNSSVCVSNTMVCDGFNNCPDGIDESINACGCPNSTHIPVCRSEDGDPTCIPPEQLCDGMEHCSNGEDESDYYCGKQFFCPGGTLYCENDKPPRGVNCVPFNLTCDGTPQCSNGRDESNDFCGNCSTNFIQCYEDPSNTCVSNTLACDGVNDCPDGIDESIDACGCPNSTHIQVCRDDRNTSCVAPEQLCDGVEDCRNGEDESNYYCGYEDDNQFSCDIHDDYNCYIPYDYVCDGERQCPNGRDEQQCGGGVLQCYSRDQGQRSSRDGDREGRERLFCPRGTLYCGDGEPASNVTCVAFDLYCDGTPHCSNGDDESTDFCGNCNLGSIQCPNSSVCVNNTMVCDGFNNCPDGIDESINACGCPNSTHIPVCRSEDGDPSCIPPEQLCDGMEHCSNGEDESDYYCGKQFFCPGGTLYCENDKPPRGVNCVPFNLTCDGTPQCSNGRDESDDFCGNCSTNFIQCYEDPSNTCVSNTVACNGVNDCPDGIDESIDACGCPNSTHIPLCRDDGNTSCVSPEQLCDGVEDCRNGEDESNYYCGSSGFVCEDSFQCSDDSTCCLSYQYVCDGEKHCPNGKDESSDTCDGRTDGDDLNNFCPGGTFTCTGMFNQKCIPFTNVCDGMSHCRDGADESQEICGGCPMNSIQCNDSMSNCVNTTNFCDATAHCDNGMDEAISTCGVYLRVMYPKITLEEGDFIRDVSSNQQDSREMSNAPVCIELFSDGLPADASLQVYVEFEARSAEAYSDFDATRQIITFKSTDASNVKCVNTTVYGDLFVERNEVYHARFYPQFSVDRTSQLTTEVNIIDNDGAQIFIESQTGAISLTEGDNLTLCIFAQAQLINRTVTVALVITQITSSLPRSSIQFPLKISIEPSDGSGPFACSTGRVIDDTDFSIDARVVEFRVTSMNPRDTIFGPDSLIISIIENDPLQTSLVEFIDYFPFLSIFQPESLKDQELSRPISIIDLPIGSGTTNTRAYVSANGLISFQRPFSSPYPRIFPLQIENLFILAPFWNDHDLGEGGNVSYRVYETGTDQNSTLYLESVSMFVSNQKGVNFTGTTMLIAHWDSVKPRLTTQQFQLFQQKISTQELPSNSYQAIVITDGITTYAVFTYSCDQLEWNFTPLGRFSAVGFYLRAPNFGTSFQNFPLSRTRNVRQVACQNKAQNILWSNLVFKIGSTDSSEAIARKKCRELARQDHASPFISANISCPCFLRQAQLDRNFESSEILTERGFTAICYVPRFPLENITSSQRCCYSISRQLRGVLLRRGNLLASHELRYHSKFYPDLWREHDYNFQQACCVETNLCNQFYSQRPVDNCRAYRPPQFAWFWGDPHITTLDERVYTFNGLGEYTLMDVTIGMTDFRLQGRTSLVNGSNATQFSVFAFGEPGVAVVEIQVNSSSAGTQFTVLYNSIDITPNISSVNDSYRSANLKAEVTLNSEESIQASFSNGIGLSVNVSAGIPSIVVTAPEGIQSQTVGLLGDFNGNKTDDFVHPNGTVLSDGASDREIHDFGQSWQTDNSTSLFTYPTNMTILDFTFPDHEPAFLDEVIAAASPEVLEACGEDAECIYDASQTGDINVGLATMATNENNNNEQAEAANNPPLLTDSSVLMVTVGMETSFSFNVSDDSDNFTVSTDGDLPSNSQLLQVGNTGEYNFTWTLDSSIGNFSLTFQATDSLGASSALSVQVVICACLNDGVCTEDGVVDTSGDYYVLNCECPEAYEGSFCDEDVDGCTVIQCFEGVACEDVPAPGVGAACGPCPQGYSGDGEGCLDIDECTMGIDSCEQECVNTDGGHECDCYPGYQAATATTCEDIDECASLNGGCHHDCTNMVGSYYCSCYAGFELDSGDNMTCTVIPGNECSNSTQCAHNCVRLNEVEQCSCNPGYELSGQFQCVDINECAQNGACGQVCTNTDGGFNCSCNDGYSIASDERSCTDIDECTEAALNAMTICFSSQLCTNTAGSYSCDCPSGTALVGEECVADATPTTPPVTNPTLSTIIESNAVQITLPDLTAETFTPSLQQQFIDVILSVVDQYCEGDTCSSSSLTDSQKRRRRSSSLNVTITDIQNNAQGDLTFALYVFTQGTSMVLDGGDLQSAIQSGSASFAMAGFSALTTQLVVPRNTPGGTPISGLPLEVIIPVALAGVIAAVLLVVGGAVIAFIVYAKCIRKKDNRVTSTDVHVHKHHQSTDNYYEDNNRCSSHMHAETVAPIYEDIEGEDFGKTTAM